MKDKIISIRISDEDKKAFEEFCKNTGMTMNAAINMYIKKVIRDGRIPFDLRLDSDKEKYTEVKYKLEKIKNKTPSITYRKK